MNNDNVVDLKKREFVDDPLTDILRDGARKLLAAALDAEIDAFLSEYACLKDEKGKKRLVRNGYMPERNIQTGIGPVSVTAPRARDKATDKEKISFTSSILPKYLRKTKSLEELLPWLYLKGISTGGFSEALVALLGEGAKGLSANTISRLTSGWKDDYEAWCNRDLSKKHFVYLWVDGIHCNVRMEESQCLLVVVGLLSNGKKELLAVEGGFQENEQSWLELLLDLKSRGLTRDPKLAIGDGALGFWKALSQVYGSTKWQRCWVHKTKNVLNKLPKSLQENAKKKIQDIYNSPDKEESEKKFSLFIKSYEDKYPKATKCLAKDRKVLLSFYDFPAVHWQHIRTTNPIESTFATVRLRTKRTRNCCSRKTVLTMAFKLMQSAQKRWQKIRGYKKLGQVIEGVKFVDGVEEKRNAA